MQRRLCSAILFLEAIVLALTSPVLISVASVSTATGLSVGLGLALFSLLLSGMLRAPWAYALGWALQVAALALGLLVTSMVVLGAVFLALWATAYVLGERIDRERADREVLEAQWRAEHGEMGEAGV